MKLQRETQFDINTITTYDARHVAINGVRHESGLILMPSLLEPGWAAGGFAALTEAEFARIVALSPALVLVGTGVRQRFPQPALLRPLIDAGTGFEIMDTGSACRTYNLLASEGRLVAAALIIEGEG